MVSCTTAGETGDGPYGPDAHWDRVTVNATNGCDTDEYVDTQNDVNDLTLIPRC
jgi:hypothetical protein